MAVNSSTKQKEVDVVIQDSEASPFQQYLMREDKTDITLTSPVSVGDIVISVSAGHGFTGTGEWILILEGNNYNQIEVESVATNDITLARPVYSNYTTAAIVIRGVVDMNVNGSITPQAFKFSMRYGSPIDIQLINLTIWNASAAGDDGSFGDLTELPNGLRMYGDSPLGNVGLGNYRANSDFKEYGAELSYTDRAGGGGTYAEDIRTNIKIAYGVVLRARVGLDIIALVQDNLTTLSRVRFSFMGQYTVGEE